MSISFHYYSSKVFLKGIGQYRVPTCLSGQVSVVTKVAARPSSKHALFKTSQKRVASGTLANPACNGRYTRPFCWQQHENRQTFGPQPLDTSHPTTLDHYEINGANGQHTLLARICTASSKRPGPCPPSPFCLQLLPWLLFLCLFLLLRSSHQVPALSRLTFSVLPWQILPFHQARHFVCK